MVAGNVAHFIGLNPEKALHESLKCCMLLEKFHERNINVLA